MFKIHAAVRVCLIEFACVCVRTSVYMCLCVFVCMCVHIYTECESRNTTQMSESEIYRWPGALPKIMVTYVGRYMAAVSFGSYMPLSNDI